MYIPKRSLKICSSINFHIILFFSWFYNIVTFKPDEMAEKLGIDINQDLLQV